MILRKTETITQIYDTPTIENKFKLPVTIGVKTYLFFIYLQYYFQLKASSRGIIDFEAKCKIQRVFHFQRNPWLFDMLSALHRYIGPQFNISSKRKQFLLVLLVNCVREKRGIEPVMPEFSIQTINPLQASYSCISIQQLQTPIHILI